MKRINLILLLIITLLLSITIASLIYSFIIIKETKVIHYDFTIGDYIGFNVDNDALHFGTMLKNSQSKKSISITNNYKNSLLVDFRITGDRRELINFKENNLILKSGEEKKFFITVKVPENLEFGTYNGKIFVIFKRVFNQNK